MFGTARDIGCPGFAQVIFGAGHAERVLQLRVAPALRIGGIGVRHLGYLVQGGIDINHRAPLIDHLLLVAQIGGEAQTLAAIIQAQADQRRTLVFIIDGGIALALQQVEPRTQPVVFAETLAEIEVPADAGVAAVIEGDAAGRRVAGTFRLHVDAATDAAAAGRHPVDKGVRPFEQLDPFQGFGGDDLARQDAIQAVEGNIIGGQRQAANDEHLGKIAETGGLPH
ncbi:hypothetical protein D3C85_716360 [compost metagenome]